MDFVFFKRIYILKLEIGLCGTFAYGNLAFLKSVCEFSPTISFAFSLFVLLISQISFFYKTLPNVYFLTTRAGCRLRKPNSSAIVRIT